MLKPPFLRNHPQTRSFLQYLLSYMNLPEDDFAGSRRPCIHIMHFAHTVFQLAFHQYAAISTSISLSCRSTSCVSQVVSPLPHDHSHSSFIHFICVSPFSHPSTATAFSSIKVVHVRCTFLSFL